MSSKDLAISVRGVGKSYRIEHNETKFQSLREVAVDRMRHPLKRKARETFWALREVSFDVPQGEVVGIIGRNGAGKSTLLKILSRITEPTTGQIDLYGRVGSLLEVGTGFHPDLTGRENVYLNGTILGMKRKEIERQFDAIVAFSEVEKFLDTPVKRYSSGMYVRLAFAVAAHLNPEILIVDEVLSVGDMQFQAKCLGKMGEVAKGGRTVLFVSHNMGAVTQLCSRAVFLQRGEVKNIGATDAIISEYLSCGASDTGYGDFTNRIDRRGIGNLRFKNAIIKNAQGDMATRFQIGDDLIVEFEIERENPMQVVRFSLDIFTSDGLKLANMVDVDSGFSLKNPSKRERVQVRIRDLRLYPGSYQMGFWAGSPDSATTYDWLENCMSFEVSGGGKMAMRELPRSSGLIFLTPDWSLQPAEEMQLSGNGQPRY